MLQKGKTSMIKKIISLICAIGIIFSISQNAFANEAQTEVLNLSLEKAIAMASENAPQFVSADNKIKDAERQLRQEEKNQLNLKGVPIPMPSGLQNAAVQQGYYVEQAKIGVESAKIEKEKLENQLCYEVTQKYYSLKLAQALVESANNSYYLAIENKKIMENQFALGMVAEIDVNNASYAVNQAKYMYESYVRNMEIAKKNLCISLQIDDKKYTLNLTDTIEYEEFSANLEEDIAASMNTRYDIFSLKSVYEQAKRYLNVAKLVGYSSAAYSSANQAVVQSEYTYQNTKKMIALSINSSYNSILDARDSYKLAEEKLSLKKQEYNISKLQHELGMITNTQLIQVMNAVSQSEIEFENSKLTYKLAVEKYGYEITTGLQ